MHHLRWLCIPAEPAYGSSQLMVAPEIGVVQEFEPLIIPQLLLNVQVGGKWWQEAQNYS